MKKTERECEGCGVSSNFLSSISTNEGFLELCERCVEIQLNYENHSCSCHINPPCGYCIRFVN